MERRKEKAGEGEKKYKKLQNEAMTPTIHLHANVFFPEGGRDA